MNSRPDDLQEHIRLYLEPCAEGDPIRLNSLRLVSSNLAFLVRHEYGHTYVRPAELNILSYTENCQEIIAVSVIDTNSPAVNGEDGKSRKQWGVRLKATGPHLRDALSNLHKTAQNEVRRLVNEKEEANRKKALEKINEEYRKMLKKHRTTDGSSVDSSDEDLYG